MLKAISGKMSMRKKEAIQAWIFILPNTLGFVFFFLFPMVFALYLSFNRWDILGDMKWVGLRNYIRLFSDKLFIKSIWNTTVYTIIKVPLTITVAIVLANALNKKVLMQMGLRTIYFLPYITMPMAIASVWVYIYSPIGPLTQVLSAIGFENLPIWLLNKMTLMPSLAIVGSWKSIGYCVLIYLAALQGIPKALYESAGIDGASGYNKFMKITVPMLTPTTFFLLVTQIIQTFKDFDLIYSITGGGPGTDSYTIVYYIYESAFKNFKMGYSSALSYVFFIIVFIVTLLQWQGQKKWVNE